MKNLTNILSYLWLLLLMAVTACSDMEREVDEMQQQLQDADQVELTIHTQVPRMKAGTRAVNGDNLTSVTALAFDKDDKLIKVVSPTTITQNENDNNESGSFTVKVPLRTRSVHFLGNYTLNSDAIDETTASALLTPLKTTDTNNLHYWGMVTFADATALKNYSDKVNLYRDKALITLNSTIGQSDYIAGLLHYYPSGALVPSGNVVGTATIPNGVDPTSHDAGKNLGTETYVYEHANNTNETHLYAICNIDGLFYKIAFATNNNGELNHFPIVRNHQYNININEIETALGSNRYVDAVAANPINNAVVEEVELSVNTDVTELYFNNEETVTVTANIPDGVSALTITAPEFDVTKVTEKSGEVTETSDYNYTVNSAGEVEFTFTLKDGSYTDYQTVSIQFTGTAEYGYELTNPEAISITLKQDVLVTLELEIVAADANNPSLTYGPNSNSIEDLQVKVTIPAGVTSLTFSSEDFEIKQATDKKKGETAYLSGATDDGYTRTYDVNNVTEPTILPFLLRLKNGVVKEYATFTFSSSGEGLQDSSVDGRVTLTAREPDDETIYWEGYLPLNLEDNTAKLSIPKADLKVNQYLVIECTKPINGTFELLHDWDHFKSRLEYKSATVVIEMTQAMMDVIENNIIITGRTNADMTLLKVSMVPSISQVNKILITAPGAAESVSNASVDINYSNSTAIEEYTITVTVPDGVTQLNYTNNGFSKVYIDNENGWYNEVPQTIDTSNNKDIALKLLVNKKYNDNPTINFGADDALNASFTVKRTAAGTTNSDVVWEGALQFQGYAVNVSKIAIPNSLLQGKLLDGAVLTLEYDVVNDADDFISICGSAIDSWAQLNGMADEGEFTETESMITMTLNQTIIDNIGNGSINMQGDGRVLKKVTLTPPVVVQDQDVYEIWVNNNAWSGKSDADVAFFGYAGQNFNTGTSNSLESTFYDASADSHKSQAMVMGSDDSFTFTITGTEPRYLTLLAASNGNAPSINLLKDGNTWTTNDKNVFPYDNSYNFSGDIGANGRLICYTLEPGTYTLQRGEADYYLYYMRVSKEKPTTLTDIIQPTIDDYTFYWRGGEFGNYLKIDDNNYIVDDDNKEFVITLTDAFRNSHGIASRTLSINSMSVQIGDNNHYTANSTNYVTISNNNAGSYSYTIGQGEIEVGTGNYKFSNFYNKIVLKQPTTTQKSGINVKNSVMLKLTDNDSEVDYYTEEMTAPALMICSPLTVPLSGHRQFDFSIVAENGTWTRQGGRYEMIQQNGTSYIIVKDRDNQYDDYIHPFNPGYDYFIDWGNFTVGGNVNRSLKSMTISTNDNDVYFSYKWLGIAKSLKIPTRYNASTTTTVNHTLSAWSWENSYYSSETYPVGTRISINFTASGTVKLIAGDGRWLYIPEFSGRYPTDSNDLHMYVSSGLYEFVVGPEIKLRRVQNGMVSAEEFLSAPLSGLRIQGDGPTIESITITTPQQ